MNNNGSVQTGGYRSKKSILLLIDVIAITLSFVLAMAIRFKFLVASLGSYLVVTTYIPFFFVALIAYVLIMTVMTEMRIDRLSKREIMETTIMQQVVLTAVYIAIFFMLHKADAISRICVGLFFIFSVIFCGIGRTLYQGYCHRKNEEIKSMEMSAKGEVNNRSTDKVRHVYIVGVSEIIGTTKKTLVK